MTDPADITPGPDEMLAMMPYATTLGIQLHQATPAQVTGSLAWAPERCTAAGILHGGAITSLADTIGALVNLRRGHDRPSLARTSDVLGDRRAMKVVDLGQLADTSTGLILGD